MRTAKIIYLDAIGHGNSGDRRHPQEIMRDLGITYKEAIPQSMFDAWHFLFCENVPDELPDFMSVSDSMPGGYMTPGWGRSQAAIDKNGV